MNIVQRFMRTAAREDMLRCPLFDTYTLKFA